MAVFLFHLFTQYHDNYSTHSIGKSNAKRHWSDYTDEEEFYQVEELPTNLGGQEAALLAWNRVYETVRPHQALGYKTPDEFYQDWLKTHPIRKEVLSDMSWACCRSGVWIEQEAIDAGTGSSERASQVAKVKRFEAEGQRLGLPLLARPAFSMSLLLS